MADIADHEMDSQVKKLKKILEGWRIALLPLKSIMLWEQQWHPAAIFAAVSVIYLIIWLMDLNSLTTFAILGALLNFVDFIMPIISNSIYGPNAWSGHKDKVFEDICRSIVWHYNKIMIHIKNFYSMRETSPIMYYVSSISMLLTMAWMSSVFNIITMLYVLSVTLLLWPGVQQRGMFNAVLSLFNKGPKEMKAE